MMTVMLYTLVTRLAVECDNLAEWLRVKADRLWRRLPPGSQRRLCQEPDDAGWIQSKLDAGERVHLSGRYLTLYRPLVIPRGADFSCPHSRLRLRHGGPAFIFRGMP
jgi:hypothetical protein